MKSFKIHQWMLDSLLSHSHQIYISVSWKCIGIRRTHELEDRQTDRPGRAYLKATVCQDFNTEPRNQFMARLMSFSKRTCNYLPNMSTVSLRRRPPKDLSIASAALPSNNAALFHGLPAVTGMIKMEIVFMLYVLFLHWQQHGYSPNNQSMLAFL